MSEIILNVGRIYRGKRPKPIAISDNIDSDRRPLFDDRLVVWISGNKVQYDSPSVKLGRKLPKVSLERFLKWADRDVTDGYPTGEWARYERKPKGATG